MAKLIKVEPITLLLGGTAEVKSPPFSHGTGVHQGILTGYRIKSGDCTSGTTYTINLYNRFGDLLYTVATVAHDAVKLIVTGLAIPLEYGEYLGLVAATDPVSDWVFSDMYFWYTPDSFFRI